MLERTRSAGDGQLQVSGLRMKGFAPSDMRRTEKRDGLNTECRRKAQPVIRAGLFWE